MKKLDISKTRQLVDLEKKLTERREKRERDLRDKHEREAIQAGLPPPPLPIGMFYCVDIYFILLWEITIHSS